MKWVIATKDRICREHLSVGLEQNCCAEFLQKSWIKMELDFVEMPGTANLGLCVREFSILLTLELIWNLSDKRCVNVMFWNYELLGRKDIDLEPSDQPILP